MPLNLFVKKSFVGLDIGHSSLKAVQVERSGQSWKVVHMGMTPTPPNAVKDGVVVDTESLSKAVRSLLRESRIGATSAVIGVAGGTVIVRTVRIPKMPEITLRKSVKYEAGRYVPSSIEDSFIEFEILGDAPENQMDVMIVAAPKELVDSRIRACAMAGLDVEVVDIDVFAMYRVLVECDPDEKLLEGTIAIVDIGSETTNVSVVRQGVFAMTRTIPHAGRMFTEALKTYFKLSDEDAESGKAQLDLRRLLGEEKPAENPPLRVMQPHADELIREIRRSLNYYQSQQVEHGTPNPVSQVLISGGGARMNGLTEYAAHKLGLAAVSRGVFDNPRFVFGGTNDPGNGLEFAVASGLALRAYARAA